MGAVRITLSVLAASQEDVTRTIETLGRPIAGLGLEGVEVCLIVAPESPDDDEEGDEDA